MTSLDFDEQPQPMRNIPALVWNLLTGLVLLGVLCIAGVYLAIFTNPQSSLNPFPPPTLPAALALPSPTPTPRQVLPATWTPQPTLPPTATEMPPPTATLEPTVTSILMETASPEAPTATSGGMPFVVQEGHPVAISNIYHPELGCNWLGVGGQIFDMKNSAVPGQQVQLGGTLSGTPIPDGSRPTLTGLLPFVPGYYEFQLADTPFASNDMLWVQLVDQAGLPMSDRIYFDTFEDCEKNLIIVNFKQVR